MEAQTLDIFSLSVLLILLVIVPLLGLWDFRRLMRWYREGRPNARLKTYKWLLAMEWGLTTGLLAWWLLSGRNWASLNITGAFSGWGWLALGLGVAGCGFMILANDLRDEKSRRTQEIVRPDGRSPRPGSGHSAGRPRLRPGVGHRGGM